MTKYVDSVELATETCCNCGIVFAMPADYQYLRRQDRKTFYCPSGHQQYYSGKSEADKLRDELRRKDEMLEASRARTERVERERQSVAKAHRKMRVRVMNGVCPCCNRTFQNLMQHMRSQHPDFVEKQTLTTLRQAFGMTQAAVAEEAYVRPAYVSLYETGKPLPAASRKRRDAWVAQHSRTSNLEPVAAPQEDRGHA